VESDGDGEFKRLGDRCPGFVQSMGKVGDIREGEMEDRLMVRKEEEIGEKKQKS